MNYDINVEEFKKSYSIAEDSSKKGLRHNTGKYIKILPYTTKYEEKHREFIKNFKACIGEFCRIVYSKDLKADDNDNNDIDSIIDAVDVEVEDKIALKSIIKEMFFDSKENIYTFHPVLFNYIEMKKSDYNKELANFLYNVLLNNKESIDINRKIVECFKHKPDNIIEQLILENLKGLEESKIKNRERYKNCIDKVSSIFKEDLDFMLDNPEFFMNDFDKLLKYYYFFYVSQLCIKLSNFFDYDPNKEEELYFYLDWESGSKTRTSHRIGWNMLKSNIKTIFSHANTLEILNINKCEKNYDYYDMREVIDDLSYKSKNEINQKLSQIIKIYKENITDVNWDKLKIDNKYECELKDNIYKLFRTIDYQFNNGTRNKLYKTYTKWFEEFCKLNFLKMRSSLGYALNIKQEYLIFLTKISIKDREKIKLKDLFYEYKRRGILFDRDSQSKIVELFEKLNLLEKKSDSGDAKYVKTIL